MGKLINVNFTNNVRANMAHAAYSVLYLFLQLRAIILFVSLIILFNKIPFNIRNLPLVSSIIQVGVFVFVWTAHVWNFKSLHILEILRINVMILIFADFKIRLIVIFSDIILRLKLQVFLVVFINWIIVKILYILIIICSILHYISYVLF